MLIDLLCSPEDSIADQVERKVVYEKVLSALKACLCPREYEIICYRYGIHNISPLTQREVAKKLGISRSYISRIEKKALQKVKTHLKL
jgi:RNA polymerase sporulation-specific sigma factor